MLIPLILVVTAVLFFGQLRLCWLRKVKKLRWFPLALLAILEVALLIWYLIEPRFSTYTVGIICLYWTAAMLLAWGVYAIVKYIQKRRK